MATAQFNNTRRDRSPWTLIAILFCLVGFYMVMSASTVRAQNQAEFRATQLMDHPVVNAKGKELAEIDNLILRRSGKVKRVILSCCGFLGLGEKRVAIPFRRLQFKGDRIIFDITDKEFTQMPQFDYHQQGMETGYYSRRSHMGRMGGWDRWEGPPHSPPFYQYPGYQPFYGTYGPLPSEKGQCPWNWSYSPDQMPASLVLNRPVVNTTCERIGYVEDLMISPEGRVTTTVLFLMIPELNKDRVAVPFQALRTTHWGLVYDIPMERLRNLPEFHYPKSP